MKPQPRYQPGDRIGGRYQVHKALMGGMGEVYLCLDLETNYPYALKTFQQRYLSDAQRLRRAFEQEVATWVALEKHPNIVRCFYMDTLDSQPFMVLEWIAGEDGLGTDLRSWLRRGPLKLKLALEIAIDICRGLIHAQQKQPSLVHRDLKPENILMAQGGLAKITDFGLAQIVATSGLEVTQENATANSRQSFVGGKGIAGTPAYMAPEQWRGERLDERTDIYALGIILHEMLTGVSPFTVDFTPTTPQQWQSWLQTMQAAHEFTLCPRLPGALSLDLDELLHCCLAKTQTARPASLADLVSHLTRLYHEQFDQLPPLRPAPGLFTAIDYNIRGYTYSALQEYERALADYERALALDPTLATAYYNRGNTYASMKEYALALADYSQAIELDPTDAQAYANRSNTYQALGQLEAALADCSQAIALDPTYAIAYYNRGNTYRALGQPEAALADYSQAIALNPTYATAYYNRGVTYQALGQPEAALADYSQAVALDPTYAIAYANRGNTYHTLQEHALALADHSQAIELDPTLATAYYNRGNTYASMKEHTLALADYSQAIELDPTDASAYSNRGVTYRALGQLEAALADYSQAIALDPTDAIAYMNIGTLLGNQGRIADALAYFEQAAQLGHPQGAQYTAQVRQMIDMESETPIDPDE